MKTFNKKSGYSLVEVLVAISILLIAIIGPMTIAVKGIQSARYSKEQTTAIFLAQEGIEAIVAIRNEAQMTAINASNLSTGWNWVTDSRLDNCFIDDGQGGNDGCNFDVNTLSGNSKVLSNIGTPKDCVTKSNCALYFNSANTRSKYTVSSAGAAATPFTRVITLSSTPGNDGVMITSEVTWTSKLFGSGSRSVRLDGAVYRLYE